MAAQASFTASTGVDLPSTDLVSASPKGVHQLPNSLLCGRGKPAAAASAKAFTRGSLTVTPLATIGSPAVFAQNPAPCLPNKYKPTCTARAFCSALAFGLIYQPSMPDSGMAGPFGP